MENFMPAPVPDCLLTQTYSSMNFIKIMKVARGMQIKGHLEATSKKRLNYVQDIYVYEGQFAESELEYWKTRVSENPVPTKEEYDYFINWYLETECYLAAEEFRALRDNDKAALKRIKKNREASFANFDIRQEETRKEIKHGDRYFELKQDLSKGMKTISKDLERKVRTYGNPIQLKSFNNPKFLQYRDLQYILSNDMPNPDDNCAWGVSQEDMSKWIALETWDDNPAMKHNVITTEEYIQNANEIFNLI